MRTQLDALIRLQTVDCKLADLERSKGDLPRIVEELVSRERALQERFFHARDELQILESQKRKIHSEVQIAKEKLARFQKQLYEVKTNREYDAVTSEIDTAKALIDEKEFNVLEIEEKIETLMQEITTTEAIFKDLQTSLRESQKDLDARLAETNALKDQLLHEREKALEGVSRQLLATYERIRPARNGEALALIINGACSACHSRIPSQRGLEIRTMNDIYTCEVCGRILVWEESRTSFCD